MPHRPILHARCIYYRRPTHPVQVGALQIGGGAPLRLQSMSNVSTLSTEEAVAQARRCAELNCDLFRYTAQGVREAESLAQIIEQLRSGKPSYNMPIIADIHFTSQPAYEALKHVEKVRINPGNFLRQTAEMTDEEAKEQIREKFGDFVRTAQVAGRALRIGVNHGSLSERILSRYGNTPEGMVASCMEYLEVCEAEGMKEVVISMKASNVRVMSEAVRGLVNAMSERGFTYPLHLGVTEAGEGEDGRLKSAIGIGSLLVDGLGDTLRVSLSEEPEAEIRFGRRLVEYVEEVILYSERNALYRTPEEALRLIYTRDDVTQEIPSDHGTGTPSTVWVLSTSRENSADYDGYHEGTGLYLSTPTDVLSVSEGRSRRERMRRRYLRRTEPNGYTRHPLHSLDLDLSTDRLRLAVDEILAHSNVSQWIELRGSKPDYLYRVRYVVSLLAERGHFAPLLLTYCSSSYGYDQILLEGAIQLGSLLLGGIGNAISLEVPVMSQAAVLQLLNGILQSVRLKMTHTEFISCPGCGRTLFDLQDTVAQVKRYLSHLPSLKIGVMGCIVNGPGEMADADYGYVGAGPDLIDLYRGQERVERGVSSDQAVSRLTDIIKADGRWVDAPTSTSDH